MSLTGVSVALLLGALVAWWFVDSSASRTGRGVAMRAILVVVALLAHLNVVESEGGAVRVRLPSLHAHDSFHYFLGTRYFAELGYTGLYAAVLRADYEQLSGDFDRNAPIRDLATNRRIPRHQSIGAALSARAAFSPARWAEFSRDVAHFRKASTPSGWRDLMLDHGYNGTPLVTALLGTVANQPWLPTPRLLAFAAMADLALIVGLGAFIAARGSTLLALGFLFFTFANPLNDHAFIGGAFLRYSYFLALAAAFFGLRRERLATSGAWLALAGWLRIFPLVFYAALLLRDLAGPGWRDRLRSSARLHVAFGLTTLAIFGATSLLSTPEGRNPWLAFADNIRTHAGTPAINQVHLGGPIVYSPAVDRLHEGIVGGSASAPRQRFSPKWSAEAEHVRRGRAGWVRIAALPLLALCLLTVIGASRTQVVLPSFLAIFCVFPMTHYYWASLALLPLVWPEDARMKRGLLLLFAVLAITASRDLYAERFDLRFAIHSVSLGVFLCAACIADLRARRRAARAAAASG